MVTEPLHQQRILKKRAKRKSVEAGAYTTTLRCPTFRKRFDRMNTSGDEQLIELIRSLLVDFSLKDASCIQNLNTQFLN